jgi:glycosyltransferase involved in cell wall biosynthesis
LEWAGGNKVKVLVVHNFYASAAPSGENVAVLKDCALLRASGIEVDLFERRNDAIRDNPLAAAGAAFTAVWNPVASSQLRSRLIEHSPDIVHVHNVFPLMSASIFRVPHQLRIPVIATLHNYRFFCAKGVPLRNGRECFECSDNAARAVLYGCYRNSRAASIPAAIFVQLNRSFGALSAHVDRVITLTKFQSQVAIDCGLPPEKVRIRANPIGIYAERVAFDKRRGEAVFVGRLSEEKGLSELLQAFRDGGSNLPHLNVVGDGPLRSICQKWATENGLSARVTFLGALPLAETHKIISQSKLLIAPFKSWEGLPTVLLEAAALGVPVVCPKFGSMQDVVINGQSGFLYSPDEPGSLVRSIVAAYADHGRLAGMSRTAAEFFESQFSDESALRQLMEIYTETQEHASRSGHH